MWTAPSSASCAAQPPMSRLSNSSMSWGLVGGGSAGSSTCGSDHHACCSQGIIVLSTRRC
eukprot:12752048-Heterocapsa_arctica.AAC.1